MERLTKLAVSVQGEEKTCCMNFMNEECIYRNGECGSCSINDQVWDKLRRYEELEEQGLLVEVVRCKDCKYWGMGISFFNSCSCAYWSPSRREARYTMPDDYCSHGARKEQEK